jgi:flagellin
MAAITLAPAQAGQARNLDATERALQRTFERLTSGKLLNRASDDAAALAVSETLRAAERSFQQGVRNLSDGVSVIRTAEGGLSQASEITSRLRELAVQAGNSTVGEAGQQAIQAEFDQLTSELTRLSETTTFNGQKLLNGDTSGPGALAVRDGTSGGDAVQVSIEDQSAEALGLAGLQADDPEALAAIDQALNRISGARAELGAAENRLESGIDNLRSVAENTAAANSRIRDTDFARAAADLTKNQILQQFQTAVQGQANVAAGTALALLGG